MDWDRLPGAANAGIAGISPPSDSRRTMDLIFCIKLLVRLTPPPGRERLALVLKVWSSGPGETTPSSVRAPLERPNRNPRCPPTSSLGEPRWSPTAVSDCESPASHGLGTTRRVGMSQSPRMVRLGKVSISHHLLAPSIPTLINTPRGLEGLLFLVSLLTLVSRRHLALVFRMNVLVGEVATGRWVGGRVLPTETTAGPTRAHVARSC